jgi:uncharacterized protein YecE (DUF72 family)
MEFGKHVQPEVVNYLLPEWQVMRKDRIAPVDKLHLYVGSTSWVNPDWFGSIYPLKGNKKAYLAYYIAQFNSIELNSTFYGLPRIETWHQWMDKAPPDFKFAIKTPQNISSSSLQSQQLMSWVQFIDRCLLYPEKIGLIFYQFPTAWKWKSILPKLQLISKHLPKDIPCHFEVRDSNFYTSEDLNVFKGLVSESNCGLVLTDTPGFRELIHMHILSDSFMIRFVSCGIKKIDQYRIDLWIERIQTAAQNGLSHLFFFVHDHDNYRIPELALYLHAQLSDKPNIISRGPESENQNSQMLLF